MGYPSAKDFEYIINHPDEPDVTVNLYINKLFEMFLWLSQEGITTNNSKNCWYVDLDKSNYKKIVSEISWNCYQKKTFEDICPRNKKK